MNMAIRWALEAALLGKVSTEVGPWTLLLLVLFGVSLEGLIWLMSQTGKALEELRQATSKLIGVAKLEQEIRGLDRVQARNASARAGGGWSNPSPPNPLSPR